MARSRSEDDALALGRVQVVGLGRVGLPLAVLAAESGHDVVGVDRDPDVRRAVEEGRAPHAEPELAPRLAAVVASGALRVAERVEAAAVHAVAVPTPLDAERRADLSAVEDAVAHLRDVVRDGDLVAVESTCPPGTADRVAASLRVRAPGVLVATATERVLPGRALEELRTVERVVGGVDAASTARAASFYRTLSGAPVRAAEARTAEVVKLVENAYRDVNLAFANEVDMLCHALGVDTRQVISLANRHPRVDVLSPGPGVGGHCLPVDPWFLVQDLPGEGQLVRTAREVNERKVAWSVERVLERVAGRSIRVGCLGLSYKADNDDLRNAPGLEVYRRLSQLLPGQVTACDPLVADRLPDVARDVEGFVRGSGLLVALVPHAVFRRLPSGLLRGRERLDLCGLWTDVGGASD